MRQVVSVYRQAGALFFEPLFGGGDQFSLGVERQLAEQHAGSQKYEVGVEDIAATVVVDSDRFAAVVHVLHLRTIDARFARFADQIGEQIEANESA